MTNTPSPAHARALENVVLLADILNRRPAMNAGLVEAYAEWTAEVYNMMGAMAKKPANDAPVAAPDPMQRVECTSCGSAFEIDTYMAGYTDGKGHCLNCPGIDHSATPAAAAPVVMPDPVAVVTNTTPREPGWTTLFIPDAGTKLYTEQQVLALLAAAATSAAPATVAGTSDPMGWPLPCDVTVGHGTMRKGVSLRTLVARMKVLYEMATGNNADEVAARTPEQLTAMRAKFLAATAAQGDAPPALPWLQTCDMAALERFAETTDDDESYDLGKDAAKRLARFGCLQSHGFGKYSLTDFGHYILNDWDFARELPFKSQAERDAARAQAKEGGAA
jgi:hypothetical protein